MSLSGKKVFVTGAAGFIGSHLCDSLLEEGARVTALIRYTSRSDWGNLEFLSPEKKASLEVVSGNIEDSDFLARQIKGKEIVFHLAALIGIPYSYHAPRSYVRCNVEGTVNVLEACRIAGTERIIHTSTSETYGTAQYTPIDENHPMQGQSPYSASKIAADKLAESYYLSFDLPVVTIRPFNTFGPRQSARAVIPTIISQALTRDSIFLGSLEPVRDFTYIKDMVGAFLRMAESQAAIGKVINAGSGKGISVSELAVLILRLMNLQKPVVQQEERLRPPNSEVYNLICDGTRARELTGWTPKYTLEDGLNETIDFISNNIPFYKPDRYSV